MNNFAERSNKVELAEELIISILEVNESVLLFTQYVQMGMATSYTPPPPSFVCFGL
ncbi:hypothetical protein [Lysinibacillus sp. NPDC093688]|uniref:hypothetical protein n=1 Tax=Lysinibacillus sp. NPDC093688 TaxID=3390577 RepID=UPI003D059F74